MGLIFAWIYFREVKKIVFREDLFSRIWSFQNFRETDLDIKQKISKENKRTVFFNVINM